MEESLDDPKIVIQKVPRVGKKTLTMVYIPWDFHLPIKSILKAFKRSWNCNGCILKDHAHDGSPVQIIMLQGDRCTGCVDYFLSNMHVKKYMIVLD